MRYLTLGFLEWYESDDSRQPHLAPLLTVPVALNRQGAKGKAFEASLEYSGDDFETNLSLVEKMRRDFAVEIPTVEDEDTPDTYFLRFEPILHQKKRWRIRRHISLSLLSFGKLLMYRDLDMKVWPGIGKHPLVNELFDGRKHDTIVQPKSIIASARCWVTTTTTTPTAKSCRTGARCVGWIRRFRARP